MKEIHIESTGLIELSVGQEVVLHADSIATAGYRWRTTEVPDGLTVTELENVADFEGESVPRVVGGSTCQRFVARAVASCDGRLRMAYGRPWESSHDKERAIRVVVSGDPHVSKTPPPED